VFQQYFALKINGMRQGVIKSLVYGAAALFGFILVMTLTGVLACLFGAGAGFYCGIYCTLGKILFMLVLFAIVIQTYRVGSNV